MVKIISWVLGVMLGTMVGAVLVALFAPISGAEVVRRLRIGYYQTLEASRQAAEQRRAELEAELAQMQRTRSNHR
jgi:gas vesicle protein